MMQSCQLEMHTYIIIEKQAFSLFSKTDVLSFEIICVYIQLEKIEIVVLHMNGNPVTGELCLPALFGRSLSNG